MKTETDYTKRPEGLTPLIFWEWLNGRDTDRSIVHNPNALTAHHWRAIDREFGQSYYHATAGGLAAQLRPLTSFAEPASASEATVSLPYSKADHTAKIRQQQDDGA